MKYTFPIIVLLLGCSGITEQSVSETIDQIEVSNHAEELNKRVRFINQPLVINSNGNAETFNDNRKGKAVSYSSNSDIEHTWYFVAEVESPVFNGEKLSATHVQVIDDKAYVSYNKQGDSHLGGLEVFDLSNKAYPKLISQALFDNADVNAITADYQGSPFQRNIWLALSHKNKGAVLREINLNNGLISEKIKDISISKYTSSGISASANGVVRSGDYLFVTSGKSKGGTFVFDVDTYDFINAEEYPNAKYVAANGTIPFASSVVSLVTGEQAELKVNSVGSTTPSRSIVIGEATHQNVEKMFKGKSTLHFSQRYPEIAFVTMGFDGLKGYDIFTDELVFTTPENMLTKGNTNGITSDFDYIYMANGADGLGVARMPEIPGELDVVFTWDMDETPGSANFMTTDGEWIFMAKGQEGLKILRKGTLGEHQSMFGYDNNGVPHGMEDENMPVCKELMPEIFSEILPERVNVPVVHPEYFLNEARELEVTDKTKVYVTFLSEGAGYRNTLGYYYYDKNDPPKSVFDLNKKVIFPNASAQGSGGDLEPGNTMKLLGEFDENTVIGFYLISNGWDGTKITDGIYSQYTIPGFNPSTVQQSIIFYEQGCSSLVMAFEDIALPGGDKDFNDAIFMITVENPDAINMGNFIQK